MGLKYRSRMAFQPCSTAGGRGGGVTAFSFQQAFVRPYLLSFAVVLDNLLDEILGLAVRVGAAPHGVLLVDGEVLRVPVDRGRAAEDQIVHSVSLHHLRHVQMPTNTPHTHIQSAAGEETHTQTHTQTRMQS